MNGGAYLAPDLDSVLGFQSMLQRPQGVMPVLKVAVDVIMLEHRPLSPETHRVVLH